jgi:pimeloyl-ACP methyl ester carboxylesterase
VLAIRDGLAVERAILLAAPADVTRFSTTFADHLRLPLKARAAMRRNLELRLDARWDELHIPTIVRKFRTPVLLIHDRGDPDVPFRHAEEVAAAWPGARVLATDGLGHRAVLRDPTVVRSAVAFLTKAANR